MPATLVTFADGSVIGEGIVTRVDSSSEGAIVVVDATPFHPVDHTWPDQPGDSGALVVGGAQVAVAEALMAAISDEGDFAVGTDIPVKRGAEGWTWLVGHRVDGDVPSTLAAGTAVRLEVDAAHRAGLSRGHTACHLASLALDLAVADLWRKDPGADALGNPDFEARANQSSRIHEDGSVDEYRLGKSLRRAGFDTETFAATLAEREATINAQLSAWVASAATSRIVTEGPTIVDRRRWHCALPDGEAVILCGGTHVASLAEFHSISVALDLSDPQLLVMTTTATPAA
ncbi:alanyl-tRNA editing protein [Microbacterium saperdae]